jgi:hypothetical protein
MEPTHEFISAVKHLNGTYEVTYLINSSHYRRYRFIDYTKKEALNLAEAHAIRDARIDAQLTNQPADLF